jgi:signal transduction histidine kinase/DNA-binding response OmpR family regulator
VSKSGKENLLAQQTARNQLLWLIIAFAILSFLIIAYAFWVQLKAKRKSLQQQHIIANQAKELAALDEVKSRFFANITHELRTPLTLILGPLNALEKEEQLTGKGQTMLQLCQRNAKNLLKLVNEILTLTKLEHKKIALEEKTVLLYPMLNKIISNFESHARINGIQFSLDYQATQDLKMLLDIEKIETIINNLLSNALKFTPNNGQVQVVVKGVENQMVIQVIDTGRGIPEGDLPFIFDRFFQSKQKNINTAEGLGIGLALSNELAKAIGGELTAQSEWGRGSTFQLTFPFKRVFGDLEDEELLAIQQWQEDKQAVLVENGVEKLVNNQSTSASFKVLLVEDNRDLRQYLEGILSNLAMVKVATNGQMALDFLKEQEQLKKQQKAAFIPDLILSDLMMPLMNGYELLKKVKSHDVFCLIPFLMLTARGGLDDKLTALRIGVDDYLTKPFEEEELVLRIQNLLKIVKNRRLLEKDIENSVIKEAVIRHSAEDQAWLSQLEKVVQNQFKNYHFNVEELVRLMHISRRSLEFKIKKITGKSPAQYIQEVRLVTAYRLLEKEANLTIKEVVYQVGLKDAANFSKNFKKRFGKKPSEFYKENWG